MNKSRKRRRRRALSKMRYLRRLNAQGVDTNYDEPAPKPKFKKEKPAEEEKEAAVANRKPRSSKDVKTSSMGTYNWGDKLQITTTMQPGMARRFFAYCKDNERSPSSAMRLFIRKCLEDDGY